MERGKKKERGKERAVMAWKKKWRNEKENTGRNDRNNSCGYLNSNKVHDIRRSRYGNEGEDVRMDRCPSFSGEVRVLCIGRYKRSDIELL